MDFVRRRHSLIEEKVFAAPCSKHSKHSSHYKLFTYCMNIGIIYGIWIYGSSSLISVISVFEEGISIWSCDQHQVQRQLGTSDKDQKSPGKSLVTRQVQGQARKAVNWAWSWIRVVHGCNTAAVLLRWEHASSSKQFPRKEGNPQCDFLADLFGGESLLKLLLAFSREASESAEAPRRACF